MEKIVTFLRQNKDLAFATVGEDGKPKIRVFEIMRIDEAARTLYFATSPAKEVYRQLRRDASVELLARNGDISVRIAGNAVFDVSDAEGREIYHVNPILQRLYEDYQKLVYFRVPIVSLDYYDLATTPPTLISYSF